MTTPLDEHSSEFGPPEEVGERVRELAFELGNRIMGKEDEYRIEAATEALLEYVEESMMKHGRSVYLLATKADFLRVPEERLELYREALEMAVRIGDHANVLVISNDLLELYGETLQDGPYVAAFTFVEQYAEAHGLREHEEYVALVEAHHGTEVPYGLGRELNEE